MAFVSTYLNFPLKTEEAMNFYASVFSPGTPPSFMRFSDGPMAERLPENERPGIMYSELSIVAGHKLMATDSLESMGHKVNPGNNTTICLNLDSNQDADRFYAGLSVGSSEGAPMRQEFFGYWGSLLDRYGIRWMLVVSTPMN